ncbi:nucleotidyltransferase substrate binding protein [Thermosynechococcus sichuanensis E542]|uniref:Nucleotidyltransferase substrate binding protein n=1 Tax=Thermosynechococcus sichuanensis E542 TaxID=2016101 RepID=A0A3B7MEU8_9CYAN|nr:HI0074 family nucleotidyltransferase substrate-binding subunit [Thermosynechococcus vestitus]AXY68115.1 nucleotidyltransferase substrate binding protein [Thermosynechococcus vestitus E542]
MDRLRERLVVAQKALATLQELPLGERTDRIIRDAAIQRFEYTLEAVWKVAQLYLREREGLDIASPKGVIRACLAVGLLTPEEGRLALKMVDDRNLTLHTYNETLADAIFSRLAQHAMLMDRWLVALAAGGLED